MASNCPGEFKKKKRQADCKQGQNNAGADKQKIVLLKQV